MLPDLDVMNCGNLAVPMDVMQHVVRVESSFNPYAIGVVGGRLVRQPANLPEALATARMLRERGFNFSLGLAQVNRYNLRKYDLSLERAFDACPNLQAGARILADCQLRSGNDWGKSLSCYYSGNFVTGFRQGYVQKVFASMRTATATAADPVAHAISVAPQSRKPIHVLRSGFTAKSTGPTLVARRIAANADLGHAKRPTAALGAPAARGTLAAVESVPGPAATNARPPDTSQPSDIDRAFVF